MYATLARTRTVNEDPGVGPRRSAPYAAPRARREVWGGRYEATGRAAAAGARTGYHHATSANTTAAPAMSAAKNR